MSNKYGSALTKQLKQTVIPILTRDGMVRGFLICATQTYVAGFTTGSYTSSDGIVFPLYTVTTDPNARLRDFNQYVGAVYPIGLAQNYIPWASQDTITPDSIGYYSWWSAATDTTINRFSKGIFLEGFHTGFDPNVSPINQVTYTNVVAYTLVAGTSATSTQSTNSIFTARGSIVITEKSGASSSTTSFLVNSDAGTTLTAKNWFDLVARFINSTFGPNLSVTFGQTTGSNGINATWTVGNNIARVAFSALTFTETPVTWSATSTYTANSSVLYNGSVYTASSAITVAGTVPGTAPWVIGTRDTYSSSGWTNDFIASSVPNPVVSASAAQTWNATMKWQELLGEQLFFDFNWVEAYQARSGTNDPNIRIVVTSNPPAVNGKIELKANIVALPVTVGMGGVVFNTIRITKLVGELDAGLYVFQFTVYNTSGGSTAVTFNLTLT